jgi:hypothetical protein
MRTGRAKPRQRQDKEPIEWLSNYCDEEGRTSPDREVDGMAEDSFPASDPPSFTGARLRCPSTDGAPLDYIGGEPPRPAAQPRRRRTTGRRRD